MRATAVPMLLAAWLLTAAPASADSAPSTAPQTSASVPLRSEVYVPAGLALYSGNSRLVAGVGGGVGYRYQLDPTWSVYTEARLGFYAGLSGVIAAGASAGVRVGTWNPQLGVGGLLFAGESIRVLSSAEPELPGRLAGAVVLRVSPLRFVLGRFTASALSVDVGCGLQRGGCALALAASLLETGLRF